MSASSCQEGKIYFWNLSYLGGPKYSLAGVERIELSSAVLETAVLPLNDTPNKINYILLSGLILGKLVHSRL